MNMILINTQIFLHQDKTKIRTKKVKRKISIFPAGLSLEQILTPSPLFGSTPEGGGGKSIEPHPENGHILPKIAKITQ